MANNSNRVRTRIRIAKARGREYHVQNPQLFAAVIADAITRRHDGNRDRAAKSAELPHNTLRRYHKGYGLKVRHETLEKLRRLVGGGRVKSLESALFTPAARDALAVYDRWVSREIRALEFGDAINSRIVSARNEFEMENHVSAGFERAKAFAKLTNRIRKRFPAAWRPLTAHLVRRGVFTARARLAQLRVVAPLFGHHDSSGIERGDFELSERELEQFVKAGVKREIILLDRESDIRRAQEYSEDIAWESVDFGWR